jgi:hypothetical protein
MEVVEFPNNGVKIADKTRSSVERNEGGTAEDRVVHGPGVCQAGWEA